MHIGILECDRQRSTCSMSFEDSTHNHRTVSFDTRSRTLRPALSSEDILLEIMLTEFQTGWNAVQNHPDQLPM